MLDEHFTAALSGSAGDDVLTSAQLRVRLLPDDYGPPELIGNEMVLQPFAESVNAALAFDLPTTVRMATASDLEPLELDQAAAWQLAWRRSERRNVSISTTPSTWEVCSCTASSARASTWRAWSGSCPT